MWSHIVLLRHWIVKHLKIGLYMCFGSVFLEPCPTTTHPSIETLIYPSRNYSPPIELAVVKYMPTFSLYNETLHRAQNFYFFFHVFLLPCFLDAKHDIPWIWILCFLPQAWLLETQFLFLRDCLPGFRNFCLFDYYWWWFILIFWWGCGLVLSLLEGGMASWFLYLILLHQCSIPYIFFCTLSRIFFFAFCCNS